MMAGARADDPDHLFECPVCLEIMKQPKILPCGHSMCGCCTDKLADGGVVECPTCREHSPVPQNGFPLNFHLYAIIAHHTTEQEKHCHKCMVCDKMNVPQQMMICHSCGDMCLCCRCCCRSEHDGHQKQELQDHMDTQVKLLEQWKDDKFRVLEPPPLLLFTVFNRCKALLSQQQADELKIGAKRKEFEKKLCSWISSKEQVLNAKNGYSFDFVSLEKQLQVIEEGHKQAITKRQGLVNAMSKMLVSGILFIDGPLLKLYSPSNSATTQLSGIDIGPQRSYHVMELLSDRRVMVAGGTHPDDGKTPKALKDSRIIDLFTGHVRVGPSMAIGRICASSAMIGQDMYVCGGGVDDNNFVASCEVYGDDEWSAVPNMIVPRVGHAVVALNGLLYAIGGYSGTGCFFKSVECYSPDKNSWKLVASLNQGRCNVSAAQLNGFIYVAGGRKPSALKVCERYNPTSNKWKRVANMNKERGLLSLVAFGGKLYALGGDAEKSVESYDPAKNQWKMEEGITLEESCSSALAVNLP